MEPHLKDCNSSEEVSILEVENKLMAMKRKFDQELEVEINSPIPEYN